MKVCVAEGSVDVRKVTWRGEWSLVERTVLTGWLFVGVVWLFVVMLRKRWMDKNLENAKHL